MTPAQEKAYAANVSGIMSGCASFRPVSFPTMSSGLMTEVMNILPAWWARGRSNTAGFPGFITGLSKCASHTSVKFGRFINIVRRALVQNVDGGLLSQGPLF